MKAVCIKPVTRAMAVIALLAAFDPAQGASPEARSLDPIVVTAQRLADDQLKARVELALQNDPSVLAEHVDVSVKNGVATLSGLVFDDWDMRIVRRVAKRIPGVKRVINDLEIKQGGE